jgi:pimeloyl-ACP methyl ester carboxylesterase
MSAEFVERRMTAEGGALTYAEAGTGAAIVVIGESAKPAPAHGLLATDRRVLLFAPPGTRTPPQAFARQIAAALDTLGLARFDVMGHGAGAAAALWLGLARPAAIGAIVLVGPTALAQLDPEIDQKLGEMKRPVLALFGTDDRTAQPEEGGRYRALLPDCNLMFVYQSGHDIATDRPEALAFMTREFCERRDLFLVSRDSGLTFP